MSSFPQSWTSTVSHWQATNRGASSLWNHGREDPLPSEVVDYVIIGGGITGTSLAYQLTRPGAAGHGKRVVLLEAKDVASGATGRNGGHIAPASWTSFPTLVSPLEEGGAGLTEEDALHVLANEADTLQLAEEIITSENLDVDFWKGFKFEVQTTPEGVEKSRQAYEAYVTALRASKAYRNRVPEWQLVGDTEEAKKISRMSSALALNKGPAGSCHPHRLATALARLALASATSTFSLFSWTPVNSFAEHDGVWEVDCGGRGSVRARDVILCSNGHTRTLFPEDWERGVGIAAHVTPFRGHASLVVPPPSYSGESGTLRHTYAVEQGPYLMFTPHSGIVLGVYNATALSQGLGTKADIFDVVDDSVVLPKFKKWLEGYCPKAFDGWGEEAPGEAPVRTWSGIMGSSREHLPLVGPVPGRPGLWAAVGFHGHGMARILTCTRSLATQIHNQGSWDARLPRCFAITEERLHRARTVAPQLVAAQERPTG